MTKESMLVRVHRLLEGSVQDFIDRLEQRNADTVMRQAIREVDAAIEDLESEIGQVAARIAQLERHEKWLLEKKAEVADRIRLAMEAQREDLARAGVSREVSLDSQIEDVREERERLLGKRQELEMLHDQLIARRSEMMKRYREWLETQRETQAPAKNGGDADRVESYQKRVQKAERVMDRIASGGLIDPFLEESLEETEALHELDELARQKEIERRLAAYRERMQRAVVS